MERHGWTALSTLVPGKAIRAAFDGGRLTSDAGVLVLAGVEHRLSLLGHFWSGFLQNHALSSKGPGELNA
jgi:hypothetical protein